MFMRPSYFFHCLQFDKPVDTCVGLFTTTTTKTAKINEKGAQEITLPSPSPALQKKRKRRKKGQGPLSELWSGLCITEILRNFYIIRTKLIVRNQEVFVLWRSAQGVIQL